MSPIAAWIAIRGNLRLSVLLLGAAVALWTAGFDIIYACQDVEFDHTLDLYSIPSRYGIPAALYASAALHALTFALLVGVAGMENLGWIALGGLVRWALCLPTNIPSSNLTISPASMPRSSP